jgi:hypothetical protein
MFKNQVVLGNDKSLCRTKSYRTHKADALEWSVDDLGGLSPCHVIGDAKHISMQNQVIRCVGIAPTWPMMHGLCMQHQVIQHSPG